MSMFDDFEHDPEDFYDSPVSDKFLKTISDEHLLNCWNKFHSNDFLSEMVVRLFEEKISRSITDDFEVVQ